MGRARNIASVLGADGLFNSGDVTSALGYTPLNSSGDRIFTDRISAGADYKNKQTRIWKGSKSNGTITLVNLTIAEIPVAASIYMTAFTGAHGCTRTYMGTSLYAVSAFGQVFGTNRSTGADASIGWTVNAGTLTITLSTSGFPNTHDYTVVFDGMVGVGSSTFAGNDQWIG